MFKALVQSVRRRVESGDCQVVNPMTTVRPYTRIVTDLTGIRVCTIGLGKWDLMSYHKTQDLSRRVTMRN